MAEPMIYVELATLLVLALTLLVLALTLWTSIRLLDLNTRPQVECYLRTRRDSPNVFDLVVANFGKGAAKDLEIELIGVDEAGFEAHSVRVDWRRKGPFTLLGPGEAIMNLFGFGPGLVGQDKKPLQPFKVRTSYRWDPFWYWRSSDAVDYHVIDAEPFRGMIPEWPKNEVAELLKKELPKIVKAIETRARPLLQTNTGSIGSVALRRLEDLMPELFAEMREDLKKTPLCREFIVMHQDAMYVGGDNKQVLVYYYESHDDLANKMTVLANSGAVMDITYTNVDRYMMSETLVEYLTEADDAA